jgi:hypothetical protein
MKARLLSGILATWCCLANAQMYQGETLAEEKAGAWSSFSVQRGNDVRFRVYTFAENMGVEADTMPPDCTIALSFVVPYSTPAAVDTPAANISGAIRVDQETLHAVTFDVHASAMGDTMFMMTLSATPEFKQIMKEMSSGQQLRVRFDVNGAGQPSAVKTIPLNGFSVSQQRSWQWCKAVMNSLNADPPKKKRAKSPPSGSAAL